MQLLALPSLAGKPGLTDLVYDAIKQSLIEGRFAPGSRLREADLARHLGVSTTPVREALARLDREGLVVIQPRRGAIVAAPSVRAITELFEIRQALESWAIRRVATHLQAAQLAELEALLAHMATLRDQPDQRLFYRFDLEFHATLCRLSGNERLADLCSRVHRQLQALWMSCSATASVRPHRSHQDHEAIIEALRQRDAQLATEHLLTHLAAACDHVLAVLTVQHGADVGMAT
jgi:DNA-binding GntR family transcriptional regulator